MPNTRSRAAACRQKRSVRRRQARHHLLGARAPRAGRARLEETYHYRMEQFSVIYFFKSYFLIDLEKQSAEVQPIFEYYL